MSDAEVVRLRPLTGAASIDPATEPTEWAMDELESRLSAVEERTARSIELMQQCVSAVIGLQERGKELEGRLTAQTLVTTTVLQMASRSDPEGFNQIRTLLEMTERDLNRANEDDAAVRELREILGTLRAFNKGGV